MKRVLAVLFLVGFALMSNLPSISATAPVSGRKVVIDAGHGGTDGGSLACPNYPEKTANLDIAYRLKALLEKNGATVYMTRKDDSTWSNEDRYTEANTTDGEVLISIHLNGSSNPIVNGTLGLYGKKIKDLKFTQVMHSNMPTDLNVPDMGVTNFASGVLLKSNMPATIQETVFISNTNECIALRDGDGTRQQEIAQALYSGLNSWFSQTSGGDEPTEDEPNCPPNSKSSQCN